MYLFRFLHENYLLQWMVENLDIIFKPDMDIIIYSIKLLSPKTQLLRAIVK